MTDPNKRFAELAGILYSTVRHPIGCKCEEMRFHCPDFTDAREVLRVMRVREDWYKFVNRIGSRYYRDENGDQIKDDVIPIDLVIDTTGLLRDEAIRWMEGKP